MYSWDPPLPVPRLKSLFTASTCQQTFPLESYVTPLSPLSLQKGLRIQPLTFGGGGDGGDLYVWGYINERKRKHSTSNTVFIFKVLLLTFKSYNMLLHACYLFCFNSKADFCSPVLWKSVVPSLPVTLIPGHSLLYLQVYSSLTAVRCVQNSYTLTSSTQGLTPRPLLSVSSSFQSLTAVITSLLFTPYKYSPSAVMQVPH